MMPGNPRPVLRGIGLLLHVPALIALLSLPVAWLLDEPRGLTGLAVTTIAGTAAGQILFWSTRQWRRSSASTP